MLIDPEDLPEKDANCVVEPPSNWLMVGWLLFPVLLLIGFYTTSL